MSKKRPNSGNISVNQVRLGISEMLFSTDSNLEPITLPRIAQRISDVPDTKIDMVNHLSRIFGSEVKGEFECYRRAGKFFFRCEHDEGEKYSHLMRNLFKTMIEGSMKKTDIHYIVTPNSASVVFR